MFKIEALAGGAIRLQKLLGHFHWQTTEKYLGGWDGRLMQGQKAISVVDRF